MARVSHMVFEWCEACTCAKIHVLCSLTSTLRLASRSADSRPYAAACHAQHHAAVGPSQPCLPPSAHRLTPLLPLLPPPALLPLPFLPLPVPLLPLPPPSAPRAAPPPPGAGPARAAASRASGPASCRRPPQHQYPSRGHHHLRCREVLRSGEAKDGCARNGWTERAGMDAA